MKSLYIAFAASCVVFSAKVQALWFQDCPVELPPFVTTFESGGVYDSQDGYWSWDTTDYNGTHITAVSYAAFGTWNVPPSNIVAPSQSMIDECVASLAAEKARLDQNARTARDAVLAEIGRLTEEWRAYQSTWAQNVLRQYVPSIVAALSEYGFYVLTGAAAGLNESAAWATYGALISNLESWDLVNSANCQSVGAWKKFPLTS